MSAGAHMMPEIKEICVLLLSRPNNIRWGKLELVTRGTLERKQKKQEWNKNTKRKMETIRRPSMRDRVQVTTGFGTQTWGGGLLDIAICSNIFYYIIHCRVFSERNSISVGRIELEEKVLSSSAIDILAVFAWGYLDETIVVAGLECDGHLICE